MKRTCLVTAMASESAPLLAHFRLRRRSEHRGMPGVLFESEHCLLLQTGIGKLKSAAAVAALMAMHPDVGAVINVGICGARDDVGTPLLASAVRDVASGKRWYPHLPPHRVLPSIRHQTLHCLDRPSSDYQHSIMFDMESAGIMEAASTSLDLSRVQCLKVVSDSSTQPFEQLSKSDVPDLLGAVIPSLDALLKWVSTLPDTRIDGLSEHHARLMHGRHSTVTQAHALKRLLERHVALTGKLPEFAPFTDLKRIRDVNQRLQDELERLPLNY